MNKRILTLSLSVSFSSLLCAAPSSPTPVYFGIFGGGGTFYTHSLNQIGTALYGPSSGGPLSVNAYGDGTYHSMGVGGIHVGYKWQELKNAIGSWSITPASELEGYYLGGTQSADDINNTTARLREHDFRVNYPMHNGVFLANAILNMNPSEKSQFHPYLGAGIGAAIISISGASSTQKTPAEPGINHYNSNPNASDWTFATQAKLGLRFDVTPHASVFAEYRFLYLSPTDYTFGSTKYPTHIATTNWGVHLDGIYCNMVTLGIRYDV